MCDLPGCSLIHPADGGKLSRSSGLLILWRAAVSEPIEVPNLLILDRPDQ